MKTLKMGENKKMEVVMVGAVQCNRYVGNFTVELLQSKAETGLWYTMISGNPHAVEGSGATPRAAVRDSLDRTRSRIAEMQNAVRTLELALKVPTSSETNTLSGIPCEQS